ncbi:Metalloenzyme, LuxS/M16 peptidase-like protein [Syncephalastrum racemosum]|uniref:Cytochrome b-c1 complex subunit 2, mitochondrial n=1 Tax=Syncephalastrum racemosum TaxID=13706 RepID=A0A1X2HFT3_SYNRA|nr:Metalloenzyme, LuxS/M16 peptidase-like protein [Syncephalastrum racemosum]
MLAASTRRAFASIPSTASKAYSTAAAAQISTASNGIKVAAIEEPGQTAGLAVVVNGGSRLESTRGAAHLLKNYGFKNNAKRTAFRVTREADLAGAVLSANLTRESVVYAAEFLNGDAAQFAEILGDAVSSQKYQAHEFVDVAKKTAAESASALANPEVAVLEAAHRAAFRTGLGNSLFATPTANNDAVQQYATELFKSGNVALVGSGLSLDKVQQFAETFFDLPSGNQLTATPTKYFGGEARYDAASSTGHYAIAFEGAAVDSADFAALEVLRYALGGQQQVQFAAPSGILGQISASLAEGSTLKAFNFGYSDAGLFGVYASAPAAGAPAAVAAAAEQLKAVAKGLSEEDFKRAVAQAKFGATAGFETRLDRLETVGAQALRAGRYTSAADVAAAIEKVSTSDVAKAAEKLLSSKPTTAALGDLNSLPYADSVSF